MTKMKLSTAFTKVVFVAILILVSAVPATLRETGDAAECTPICDDCHDSHDRVYQAFLDITRFTVPSSLNGSDMKKVEVQLRLHGNVGLGYTTIRRGYLILTANEDRVAVPEERQNFISMEPGFKSFFWNVSGRLEGTDTMHVEVWALGVHLAVEFFESADSGPVSVTNPLNAPPRVTFLKPDGYNDVATNDYTISLHIDDPNADPILGTFYYDTDRDRDNGKTLIVRNSTSPETFLWDTRSLPNGWYWIHVDVDDQRGGTDSATSLFPVIVSHSNLVPNTELVTPVNGGTVYDPKVTLSWRSEDLDGDSLTYEVWVGRTSDFMELVGTTTQTSFSYAPDDNARLLWNVIPNDGKIRGWCRNGPFRFTTKISYPVEVDLLLPANNSLVQGPDVKLVWYGRDLDYEQVKYDVFLSDGVETTRVAKGWNDPAGPVFIAADLTPGTTYTWWVEGDNPYSPRGVSQRWSFTVAQHGAPVVELDEETVSLGLVTLSWRPSAAGTTPVTYNVHLVDRENGDVLLAEGTMAHSLDLFELEEDMSYHWYVIPYDGDGDQGYSVPTFRTFIQDLNQPPNVTITRSHAEVEPGMYVLEWETYDVDGDTVSCDVYFDALNATTLVLANTAVERLEVQVEPGTTYRWRVAARDVHGIGGEAMGTVVAGPGGSDVGASGRLLSPLDGNVVEPNVVNLTWEATDPLERAILFSVYMDAYGGDPLDAAPVAVNCTLTWWLLEVEPGSTVSWAVRVRPYGGASSLLGSWTFTVSDVSLGVPEAVLGAGPEGAGAELIVRAFETVQFDANGSMAPGGGPLEYWFDFGDGRASGWIDESSTSHAYVKDGTYNATLVVRSTDGLESDVVTVRVEVQPGDLGSEEEVPALHGAWTVAGMMAAAIVLSIAQRTRDLGTRRRGGGTR